MEYQLTIERTDIHGRDDLSSLEARFALAMADGVDPKNLKGSDSTRKRAISGLKKKGIITQVEPLKDDERPVSEKLKDDPASKWLSSDIAPLDESDGLIEFESFSAKDIEEMEGTGRFVTFCRLFGADGTDAKTRTAWSALEKRNTRNNEMVGLYPLILKAAQHQKRWAGLEQIEPALAPEWLNEEHFNKPVYAVRAGEDPPAPETDEEWIRRAQAASNTLLDMDVEFTAMHGNERPKQAARRLEAKLRMEQNNRGVMG